MQTVISKTSRFFRHASEIMRYCIVLALGLGMTVVVLYARMGGHARTVSTLADDTMLHGFPLPEFRLTEDRSARFRLLFPSGNVTTDSVDAPATIVTGSAANADIYSEMSKSSFSGRQIETHINHQRQRHSRLVVIPDIHGDGPQALRALRLAGLVHPVDAAAAVTDASDSEQWQVGQGTHVRWAGGDAVVVQLGDVLDRGPNSLALLILLEQLTIQARAVGGDIITLLGNHELMNIYQDFRYVSPTELLALAEAGSLPLTWTMAEDESVREVTAAGDSHGDDGHRSVNRLTAANKDNGHSGSRVVHGTDDDVRQSVDERFKEDVLLSAELLDVRKRAVDRELLYGMGTKGGSRDYSDDVINTLGVTRASLSIDRRPGSKAFIRRNLQQQRQHEQHRLVLKGLDVWRDALAPGAPLGSLIRQRPLAAIVDAGGCRILAVHAGAFPWMLHAVDQLLAGNGNHNSDGAADVSDTRFVLRPEQYVEAWNVAVAASLQGCEGRQCHGKRSRYEGHGSQDPRHGGGENDAAFQRSRLALADLLLGSDGAVWSRRYVHGSRQQVCGEVAAVVRSLEVQQVVVGHTVQPGGKMSSRCGGQLLMADVGLSREIAGEMAVLQCSSGLLEVVYGSGRVERLGLH